MVNQMEAMKMKGMLDEFRTNHPKVLKFFQNESTNIEVGTIIEMTLTTRSGETVCTNIKVTPEDMELIEQFKKMASQK